MWVDTHVYRIIQELATNAAKHAQPTRIVIMVDVVDDLLFVRVVNDGKPLVVGEQTGLGLEMVWQRVRALGGEVKLTEGLAGTGGVATFELRLQERHYQDERQETGGC